MAAIAPKSGFSKFTTRCGRRRKTGELINQIYNPFRMCKAMISKVTVQNFKRFKEPTEFALKPEGVTFLAGGNNSGKSSLLQALAVWDFARSVMEVGRGPQSLLAGWKGKR